MKIILLLICLFTSPAIAGDLTAPAAPSAAGSALHTLEDIYQRLNSGAPGTKRTGALSEPLAGPAATGHSLNDIMSKAPMPDNTNGAVASDVTCGRIFWGLRTDGTWGQQTGGTPGCTPPPFHPTAAARTGQTTSYAAGDDGALQPGVAWPDPRFADNGNGTITDNLTGLVWMQNANCWNTQTWANALAKVAGLNAGTESCISYTTGTHADWRLPNREELSSLIDYGRSNPALPTGHPFSGVQTGNYWSSTTLAGGTDLAWLVNFDLGNGYGSKTGGYYVWPVRGGQ